MVDAQIAVLADTLRIEGPVMVRALHGLLGATLGVVAILAHPISIVLLGGMGAFGNFISVARYFSLAVLVRVINRGIIKRVIVATDFILERVSRFVFFVANFVMMMVELVISRVFFKHWLENFQGHCLLVEVMLILLCRFMAV